VGNCRCGWNEGQFESFAYTEDNEGVLIGGFAKGTRRRRTLDRAGVAFVSGGISAAHAEYLADGGLGFLLGDGGLNYGRENIQETFYTTHIWRGLFFAFDLQHVNNPGYSCESRAGACRACGCIWNSSHHRDTKTFHHGDHGAHGERPKIKPRERGSIP
jgi:hypothetical protein